MADSLFGTDGVRGLFGEEPISPHTVLKLGWAAGSVFLESGVCSDVLIGKDTRVSGYILESALEAGFASAGLNVTFLGPMPTPGIAFLTRTNRSSAGVVISASHNPFHDNGIKIFSPEGTKLGDDLVRAIDERMQEPMQCVPSSELGKASRMTDAYGRYIEFCKSTFPESLSLSGLKVVIDCANGAAYEVAPRVFSELGADIIAISNEPDGFNINENCGSMNLQGLMDRVKKEKADLGIALDGDADRALFVDSAGNRVDGDQALYLMANHRHQTERLGGGVVGTIMSNHGLAMAFQSLGIEFERARVGDKYVHELLVRNNWLLGGESSGHTICLDKSTTGDGIIAALEVCQVILESGQSLKDLVASMPVYPQCMINVNTQGKKGKEIVKHQKVATGVKEIEEILGTSGRVVLRPSGTEPLVRVMVEGEDKAQVQKLTEELADKVSEAVQS